MSTPVNSSGNLVGDHMYMVTGVNTATGALAIQNPWNTAYSGSLSMTFTETIQELAADNCTVWTTSGVPAYSPAPSTTTIASNGATTLAQVGNLYELNPASGGTGPLLEYQGSLVTTGEFAGWTPVGAKQTGNGYEVAWSVPGANQYTVWNTDANGNYTSSRRGRSVWDEFRAEGGGS